MRLLTVIIHAGGRRAVGRTISCVYALCVCVCPCSKRKTVLAINTKAYIDVVHGSRWPC